ncbi:MAG: hypothetical protein ACLUD0_03915 [Eubacterium ramulus]
MKTDQYAEINTLMENYYASYASGNTGEMLGVCKSDFGHGEKLYLHVQSVY